MHAFMPLPDRFRHAVLGRQGGLEFRDVEFEEPGPEDLVFRMLAAGLTPEDLDPERHRSITPPAVPVVELAAVGEAVSGWTALERAVLLPPPPVPGQPVLSGLSEWVTIPSAWERNGAVIRLPGEIPLEEATLVPTAARAARLLAEADVPTGGSLLVLGLGLLGQLLVLMARHHRVDRLIAADPSPTLRRKAEYGGAVRVVRLGEEDPSGPVREVTGGRGVNAAVVLVPDPQLVFAALQMLAPGGTLILAAAMPPRVMVTMSPARIQTLGLRIQGVGHFEPRDLREAFAAIRQGYVNAESLVSRRIAWEDLPGSELTPEYWEHGSHVVVGEPVTGG